VQGRPRRAGPLWERSWRRRAGEAGRNSGRGGLAACRGGRGVQDLRGRGEAGGGVQARRAGEAWERGEVTALSVDRESTGGFHPLALFFFLSTEHGERGRRYFHIWFGA
jgi:hypothetical protein